MKTCNTLDGKVALITGASKGIGKALSIGLAEAGASISCAARTKELLDATVDGIRQKGGNALAVAADVTKEPEVRKMLQKTVEYFGKLDILILNAGDNFDSNFIEKSDAGKWRRTIELNLIGAYYCAKAAIPYLKKSEAGKVITIGSGLGRRGMEKRSAYACSKAGLWMLTRVLAQELRQDNISVNELIPGPVDTGGISETFRKHAVEEHNEWVKKPEDVVQLGLFLASQPDVGPTAQSFSLMRREM